jgi:hypothetical protein
MSDTTQVTVQCAGLTNLGARCDRELTVHVFRKFRHHYCYDHTEDGDER